MKIISFIFISLSLFSAYAQNQNKNPYPVSYKSEIDQNLILKSVVVAPAYDNVGGIYKKAAEKKLFDLITDDYFWTYTPLVMPDGKSANEVRPDWFEEKSDFTKNVIRSSKADSLLSTIITKSSSGITVNLTLFTRDGLPLIAVNEQNESVFEISKLNEIVEHLYAQMKQKLPYNGTISSRKGQLVTINLGTKNGLKVNDQLSVAQIIHIKRHPKLKFMTGVEKEVIGQIIVTKVDSDLSFAQIHFEREPGVIEKGSKLLPFNPVVYNNPLDESKKDKQNENEEWVPAPPPQYGKIFLGLGLSQYAISSTTRNTNVSYTSSQNLAPEMKLGAELWITQEWFAGFSMQQGFFKAPNGLSGSSPAELSFNTQIYDLLFGYRYAVTGNFWGPQLTTGLGYLTQNTRITDSSPVAFTSGELNAWQLHIGGYFPISEDYKSAIGASTKFIFFEKYAETPVDSGSSDPQLTSFSIYYNQQITHNVQIKPELNYSLSSVRFSSGGNNPNPVRSTDEKKTTFLVNLEYLF